MISADEFLADGSKVRFPVVGKDPQYGNLDLASMIGVPAIGWTMRVYGCASVVQIECVWSTSELS